MKISQISMPIIIATSIVLTGCTSSTKSNFGCDAIANTSCIGMQQVNAIADNGGYGGSSINTNINNLTSKGKLSTANLIGQPIRYGEEVSKVWISPYQDSEGDFHDSSNVYIVTKPGHWVNYPLKEVRGKG